MNPSTIADDLLLAVNSLISELAPRLAKAENQRADVRYPFNEPVTLGTPPTDGKPFRAVYPAWALDISNQGIGLILDREASPGLCLACQLRTDQPGQLTLPVRLIFCKRLVGSIFRIGAEFTF